MLSPNRALLLTLTRKESLRTGSAHHNHVLLAGHELSDDRGARDLAGDQQPAGGLCAAQHGDAAVDTPLARRRTCRLVSWSGSTPITRNTVCIKPRMLQLDGRTSDVQVRKCLLGRADW